MKLVASTTILVFFFLLYACTKEQPREWQDPEVSLEKVGGCKDFTPKTDSDYPNDTDCLSFEFDGDSILTMTHINAGFNCCPEEFIVKVDIRNDTIYITESERDGLCDCNCLYDLHFTIQPLPPGIYHITVDEPYVRQSDDPRLEDQIDLTKAGSGEFCVSRSHYPWGI
ncbi:MAG: hypothetical protein KAH17_06410 [Bacteroidales bacterium]|nr:hypothetical protein [Bacteroidales bacterium]